MNYLMDIIKGRRSVRRFTDKEVSEEAADLLLESMQWAPSWANTQCWEAIVIRDQDVRDEVLKAVQDSNPGKKGAKEASLIIALCGRLEVSGYYKNVSVTKFGDWFMFDLGLAAQNLCLAAHDLGLGTLILGMFDHRSAGRVLKIQEGYEVVALIPVGYPRHEPKSPKRKAVESFRHENRFTQK